MGVVDLIVREQFTSSCPEDLSIWLKQSNPKTLDELSRLADQYLAAHSQKLSSKEVIKRDNAKAGVKDNHSGFPPASAPKCFLCNRVGHRAIDCRVKPEGGRNEYNRPGRHAVTCYQCGEIGHEKRFCRNTPTLKLLLGVEATPLDLRHNPTELDALCKLEDYRIRPERRMKNIWSSNLERKLKSYVMVPA